MSIEKILVLSTSHIPERVYNYIVSKNATFSRDEGDILSDTDLDTIREEHPNLDQIYQIAKDNFCDWVMFDCDGEVYDEISTFEWE